MFYFFFHLKTLIIRDENLLSPPQRIPNPEMKKKKRGVAIILKILYVYIYIYIVGVLGSEARYVCIYWVWDPIQGRKIVRE